MPRQITFRVLAGVVLRRDGTPGVRMEEVNTSLHCFPGRHAARAKASSFHPARGVDVPSLARGARASCQGRKTPMYEVGKTTDPNERSFTYGV
jgi:hypothetical protein